MSLGLRLLLLNGLVLVLVLGVFASVSYVTQEQALRTSLDASLREQATLLRANAGASLLQRRPGGVPGLGGEGPAFGRPGADGAATVPLLGRPPRGGPPFAGPPGLAASDVFTQVTLRDGTVLARSRNLDERTLPAPTDLHARVWSGEEVLVDVDVDGEPLRMLVAALAVGPPVDANSIALVQVARPLAPVQISLAALRSTFLTLGLGAVLVSLLFGWLLARVALRPIDRLAAAAQAIGRARDFARRVPTPLGPRRDEIGRLGDEINGMLTQLQDAYAQLEAALAAQRRFVADASHELRTPLTSLRGNIALLQRATALGAAGGDPEEEAQLLADMAAETERLARLVADLLLLAQADAGQHLTLTPVEISPLVRDTFRAARFLRPGIELRLGETPNDVWVEGDADRLKQLLLILLDNGLKYTPLGGRVTISATQTPAAADAGVIISVQDTGPGITAAAEAHLFERFYRADQARSSDGAGLGLAIARWIADEHRGSITVESVAGEGSTFLVWLPSRPELPATLAAPQDRAKQLVG